MNLQEIAQTSLDQLYQWGPGIIVAIILFLVFFILAQLTKTIILHSTGKIRLDPHLGMLMARVARITIIILGLVTALGTMGIDISAIVAGLGLTGFALGFALKDTISNLLSGVLILLYRPFTIGDNIKVAGHEGKVVTIDLRYTELEYEKDRILIPNSKLFTDPLVVSSEEDDISQQKLSATEVDHPPTE